MSFTGELDLCGDVPLRASVPLMNRFGEVDRDEALNDFREHHSTHSRTIVMEYKTLTLFKIESRTEFRIRCAISRTTVSGYIETESEVKRRSVGDRR